MTDSTKVVRHVEGLRDWLLDEAEKMEDAGITPNRAAGWRLWGEAVDSLLTERAAGVAEERRRWVAAMEQLTRDMDDAAAMFERMGNDASTYPSTDHLFRAAASFRDKANLARQIATNTATAISDEFNSPDNSTI